MPALALHLVESVRLVVALQGLLDAPHFVRREHRIIAKRDEMYA